MKKPELLSPVGNFECLKAAVQNGADAVYFGSGNLNARVRATNFSGETLKEAIKYAKLRNVKTNLTLNTLIKNDEFEDAIKLALEAYNYGIDAIIIQDLGLAKYLLKHHPEIQLHASTQMTVHNLSGVKQLEKAGFSRVVLARELDINEIKQIKENTNTELEVFIHGALCISYSGQCLFSSIVGGRSGNRGLCAQPCRLPYELIDSKNNKLDSGYLLSPRDLCGLDFLPELIKSGIDSFKIEGRLKSPEYVATVTKIYRKYIDYIWENIELSDDKLIKKIHEMLAEKNDSSALSDQEELLQVFNRGGFSKGHLSTKPNRELIFKEKSNNEGLYLGKVFNFNEYKGHISFELENSLSIGDKIKINNDIYTVSELMIGNNNYKTLSSGSKVIIGRMKGDIRKNNKIYKIESKSLNNSISPTFSENKEFKKIPLFAEINIHENRPISLRIWGNDGFYKGLECKLTSNVIPEKSQNLPISKEKIINQLSKTGNTQFEFVNIKVNLDDNLFIPISILNDLRRTSIINLENMVLDTYSFNKTISEEDLLSINSKTDLNEKYSTHTNISLLLSDLKIDNKLLNLSGIDNLYIPYKFFLNSSYFDFIKELCQTYKTYIYMPNVIKQNFEKSTYDNIKNIILKFNIFGAVISHISQIDFFQNFKLDLIGNYTLNIFNTYSMLELKKLGFSKYNISPELDKTEIKRINNNVSLKSELIVYGKLPLMTNNYCYLGSSNKCYPECTKNCINGEKYYLKDRMNFKFRIVPDNTSSLTTIYNSKTTSITYNDLYIDFARIDILDEKAKDIQNIINTVKSNKKFEGKDYTNGRIK